MLCFVNQLVRTAESAFRVEAEACYDARLARHLYIDHNIRYL